MVETSAWPREHLDLCGPAFLRIGTDGSGKMAFGAPTAGVNTWSSANGADSNGSDEGDPVQGSGWADVRDGGSLEGEIEYDNGDETTFTAGPWPFSAVL